MTEHNRVCAEIDLDAIAYNMEQMKKRIGDHARLIAVVKAEPDRGRQGGWLRTRRGAGRKDV